MNKKNILIVLLTIILNSVWGQTELSVNFKINDKVTNTDDFKFSIITQNDTVNIFNSILNNEMKKNQVLISIDQDSITGVFKYKEKNSNWKVVIYKFQLDTIGLKRININLYFSVNNNKTDFLQDFTIDKFYQINSVSITNKKIKIGSQPVFTLINHSDTIFYGASPTNHFYGTIKAKTEFCWYDFSGSYCTSTAPEKPLNKSDTIYSWIPNYSLGDEYKINSAGTYKYVVPLGMEKYSEGIPLKLIYNGETRTRTRTFFELETEFKIE